MNMEILQLIGSYGFPIVACVAMGWYVYYTSNQNREDLKNANELHDKEMSKITEALNNNTIAIRELVAIINTLKKD